MKERGYYDFTDSFYEERPGVIQARVPTEGMIELTRRCNLRCSHCYIGDARWVPDPKEYPLEHWKSVIDALAERGTLWLTFTGGEAMVSPHFEELWRYAFERGFQLILYTNALAFTEARRGFFAQYPPRKVEVSIYGSNREVYERLTRKSGSFAKFLRGIEQIRQSGLIWWLKAPITRETAHDIPALKRLAAEWGTFLRTEGNINPSIGEGSSAGLAPCAVRLDSEELDAIEREDHGAQRELAADAASAQGHESSEIYHCGAGENSFYLTARGELQMCVLTKHRAQPLPRSAGGIPEAFDRAWEHFGAVRKLQRDPSSPCGSCDLKGICGNCPGFAQLENGNEQDAVEWVCRQTHLRAHRLDIPHRCDIRHFVYRRNI